MPRWKDQPYKHAAWLRAQAAAGLKLYEIAKLCGVRPSTIAKWACMLRVPMVHWSARTRRYQFDQHYLDVIDTDSKAYMLGLLAADGCVARTGWEVRLKLRCRDVRVLHTLKKRIGFTGPLRRSGADSCLALCSIDLVAALRAYGIHPCKSLTIIWPKLQDDLVPAFMRGVFDGDGSVLCKQVRLVSGSRLFVVGFSRWYRRVYKRALYIREERDGVHPKWRVVLNRRDASFIQAMYKNATVYIPRKYAAYRMYWSNYVYRGLRPKRGPYKTRKSQILRNRSRTVVEHKTLRCR